VLLAVVYFVLRLVLRIAPEGDARGREAEILVLRHQLAVMKRKAGRPKLRRLDRMLLAAFARLVPRERWSCFIVSPQTSFAGTGSWWPGSGRSGTGGSVAHPSIQGSWP
jgi:hypothetical protein